MTLDDLERPIRTLAEKLRFTEPFRKKLNEDRHILYYRRRPRPIPRQKCRAMIVVSGNMKCMPIFAEVAIGDGSSHDSGVVDDRNCVYGGYLFGNFRQDI